MRVGSTGLASLALLALTLSFPPANAQENEPVSQCLAVAQTNPNVHYASFQTAALERGEVSITFVGHSTFRIETEGGIVIATDYAGFAGTGRTPDVVTMNRAHTSHFTLNPDPSIPNVLPGWGEEGEPARHRVEVGDVYIRNVTTDIRSRSFDGDRSATARRPDDNSIFIFEVAGLCIGHLGHLHHQLSPGHRAAIGRLDIVFVPVDGGYTMAQAEMTEVLQELRAQIVIPMHYFGVSTLNRFLVGMEENFPVDIKTEPSITVSLKTLPDQPTVIVLPGY